MTNPATKPKSIGLLAFTPVVMVFASPLRQFYHDETNPAHLPGLFYLDIFIMTRKLSSIYQDYAKTHANPDTDGNSLYHRAVIAKRTMLL